MARKDNWDDNVTITGTDESDELNNWGGSGVTINTGNGANTVHTSDGDNILIFGGTGDDSLRTWNGTDITIDANDGNDTIDNYQASKISVVGGAGNDSFMNWSGTDITLDAGDGNDTVKNSGAQITIFGGAGNDSICNDILLTYASDGITVVTLSPDNVLIDGGNDNDTIFNVGNNVSINGGAGDDSISNGGNDCLITGGDGNDTLTGHSAVDVFAYAGGNDVITNYSGEDIVYISTGRINSYSFNGADLIFYVNGGSLTLKSMKNHAITVQDSSGNTSTKIYGTGYSGADVMKIFVQSMANSSLDTDQKLDEAVRACSHFNSLQEVKNQMITDLQIAGDGENFLRDYCGIFLDNADSGAVTGWDAGGLSVKTKDDLLPKSGTASYPTSTMFTKRGLTLVVPERSTLNEHEQLVVQGLYSWWMEDAIKLIEETYGLKFTDKPLTIELSFFNDPSSGALALGGPSLSINMAYYSGIDAADKTGNGLDAVLAHEFTHVMQYNFNSYVGMSGFITQSMASFTAGWDVDGSFAMRDLVNNPTRFSEAVNSNDDVAGMIFFHYLMRQAADNYDAINTTPVDNPSSGGGDNPSSGGDNPSSGGDNPSSGGDNPSSGGDNPSNNNQIVYTGGNKIVSNYNGQAITLGAFTGASFNGNTFVVNSPTGALVIENVMDKIVDLRDGRGNAFIKAYTPSTASPIYGWGIDGYQIISGAANGTDVIFAGDGGSQLWGGSGLDADALVGGSGTDIFVGGRFQGSDNIFNASSADAVNLTDASLSDIVGTAEVGNNVLIGFNTGNIISIQSTELLSAAINFADGSSLRFNHATKAWQSA